MILRSWLKVILILIIFSIKVNAQTIHNHPQKSNYANSLEHPTASAQEHWRINAGRLVPDNTCALASTDDLTCAHIHDDLTCPMYAEFSVGDKITCNFSVILHHFPGSLGQTYMGFSTFNPTQDVIWDLTGTSNAPMMVGDPIGDKVFTGHFTTATLPVNIKGWWSVTNKIYFRFNNGDEGFVELLVPFWSTQNPTIDIITDEYPKIVAKSNLFGVVHPEVTWGQLTVEYAHYIPLLPISQPWITTIDFYSYGRINPIPGVNNIRYDMDLHHEIPGRIQFSTTQAEDQGINWTFDPAVLGTGTHKVAVLRVQPDGDEQLTSVLVINVSVGDVSNPPLVCTDPLALNFNGPLPCTYPVPVDTPFNPNFVETPDHHFKITNPNTGTIKVIQ